MIEPLVVVAMSSWRIDLALGNVAWRLALHVDRRSKARVERPAPAVRRLLQRGLERQAGFALGQLPELDHLGRVVDALANAPQDRRAKGYPARRVQGSSDGGRVRGGAELGQGSHRRRLPGQGGGDPPKTLHEATEIG